MCVFYFLIFVLALVLPFSFFVVRVLLTVSLYMLIPHLKSASLYFMYLLWINQKKKNHQSSSGLFCTKTRDRGKEMFKSEGAIKVGTLYEAT